MDPGRTGSPVVVGTVMSESGGDAVSVKSGRDGREGVGVVNR